MSERTGGSRRLMPSSRSSQSSLREGRSSGPIAWQRAVVPLALVAIVLAASLVAHGKSPNTHEVAGGTAAALTRTLSCVGDLPNASTFARAFPASNEGVTTSGARVAFAPSRAADGYAVQWTSGKMRKAPWLAARACPALSDDWWFVGVGSSQSGLLHDSVLTLDNPEPVDATFDVRVYGPNGEIDIPGGFPPVPAGTSKSFDLRSYAPASTKANPNPDLAVHISVTQGLVAASMRETWTGSSLNAPTQQWVPTATPPSRRLQLMTMPGTITPGSSLLVTNPGSSVAVVSVKAVNADATFTPTSYSTLSVPPATTMSYPIGNLRKVSIGSLILSSNVRVSAAMRSVNGTAEAYAVPAQAIGAESTAGLPAGIPATLSLTAPSTASVTLHVVDAKGTTVKTQVIQVAAGKLVTVALPKNGAALRLTADRRSAVAAAISLVKNGIAMIAMVPTANLARVPAVIAQPY